MRVLTTVEDVRNQVKAWKKEGLTVGLVPTMGYLHEGHASLVQRAKNENDRVVVSVFVNPTQFGPNEDLATYPRDLDHDAKLLESLGVDILFHPTPEEMYPGKARTWVTVEDLTTGLCGKTRPTHFRGVCTVVSKLMNIVTPDKAYFGRKDAQQLAVIRQMVKDLNIGIDIVGCPIVREADGLAKSSRNKYLSESQRQSALVLSKAVAAGKALVAAGQTCTQTIVDAMVRVIESDPTAKIDYVEAVDALTMAPVTEIKEPVLFAMAVYIGKTRLIDNFGSDEVNDAN